MLGSLLRKGAANSFRLSFVALLMASLFVLGSVFISSIGDIGDVQGAAAPVNVGDLKWHVFDFSGLPFASSPDGKFGKFTNCAAGGCIEMYDLRSVWVSQDANFLAWKVTGLNFSNATFCGKSGDLVLEMEFDSDGNVSSGCRAQSGDPCYPGADYQILVNRTGNGTFYYFNSSGVSGPCPAGNCFNISSNVTVFVNISKTAGLCDVNASAVRFAVNKSHLVWSVLTFGVASKPSSGSPVDHLGADKDEFSSVGFGGGDFFEEGGNFSFMFRRDGCGSFTNQSYCTDVTLNGNFSCLWESDFNECRPNMTSSNYGCSDFCGSCSSQSDCNGGARGTCKWVGSGGPCIEDFEKFRFGGNCDQKCGDCFNQNSCVMSRAAGSCSWLTDPVSGFSFCAEGGTTVKTCGYNSETSSCFNCNISACTSPSTSGICAWDAGNNFCFSNATNTSNFVVGVNNTEYSCFDSVDNDNNMLTDCKDPYCSSDKFCGGGEFEKKVLTDIIFVTAMRQMGICTQTSSGLQCDKEKALVFDAAREMNEKPGPPLKLKEDTDASIEPSLSYPWLDILGFGFKDMGKSIGMGMMLKNASATSLCSNSINATGIYLYYVDTDSNASTGCWENISNTNVSGIEFKFVYNISYNGSASQEMRQAYRCLNRSMSVFGLFPAKLSSPINPFQPDQGPLCSFGAAVMVVPLADMGNPKTSMVYHVASVDNVTIIPGKANDTIFNATYTPGAVDFIPPDCEKNPLACGTAFAKIGGGRFSPFEDCSLGSQDEDQDGTANCDDTDCVQAPWCSYNRAALLANDKTAPRVLSSLVDAFDRFAMLRQSTSEPSNLSIEFYNTSSSCTVVVANLTSFLSGGIEFDRFKPWHSVPFDNVSISDSSVAPLKANTTYYYRTKNCDLSQNCAVSACLNFTTKTSGTSTFRFGFSFDSRSSPSLSGLNMSYFNGTSFVSLSNLTNISFLSNTTLRFDNANSSNSNGSVLPWNIQFEGVDLAKATSINMTDMIQVTQLNETGVGQKTETRSLIGINGTKWQEMAQVLGIDSILVNISQVGNRIIKCDVNGSGCVDVTPNLTIVKQGSNYTTIRVPTYSLGGFSSYGVNNSGVLLQSDRSSYQCYPTCTIYWNVTNYQANFSQLMNVTIMLNDTSARAVYNISYLNLSSSALNQWVLLPENNLSNITNYNFVNVNSSALNSTVHQFRIVVNLSVPIAERVTFNFTITNRTGLIESYSDIVWFDTINVTNPEDSNISIDQTPDISFRLFSLNDSNQSCTLWINGSRYDNGTVVNSTLTAFTVNSTLVNGTYQYNVSCVNSETGDSGNSSMRSIRVTDITRPSFNQTPASSSPTTISITLSWTTDERTNTTISHGTSQASFSVNTTETGFTTGHAVNVGSLVEATTYYYNVTACDNVGNCNTTGPLSFTTSSSSSSSSGSSGGGGGAGAGAGTTSNVEKVSKLWSDLPAGTSFMNIAKAAFSFRKITIEATASSPSAELSVSKLDAAPSVGAVPGTAYQYVQVETKNIVDSVVKSAVFDFNVEKKWLSDNSFIKDQVALYRYSGGAWNELATKIVSEDTVFVSYQATSLGFSYFAVAAKGSGASASGSNASGSSGSGAEGITGSIVQEPGSNESSVSGNASQKPGKPSLMPDLGTINGVPLLNLIAFGIVGVAIIGVIGYIVSRRREKVL
ncbi:PGF-pre-PGF domain-containing protein [Candidatus Woesearchaeota archaeon]|nr:PGF-pre-PGF domain-containing protein [Candidatus Woesearchaeota archaeon]